MSRAEADELIGYGRFWFAKVKLGTDYVARDGLIQHLNGIFTSVPLPIRLSRGWQPDDPVIRVGGRSHRYADVAAWASGQQDGGRQAAQTFRDWYEGDNVTLSALPPQLQALAAITHLAEVGRGYWVALETELMPWIADIADAANAQDARAAWANYTTAFPPSLTYAQDAATDYMD
jgi:hypothetical protein